LVRWASAAVRCVRVAEAGAGQAHCRPGRVDLLGDRRRAGFGDFVGGPRLLELLCRADAAGRHRLRALVFEARPAQLGLAGVAPGRGRGQRRLGLGDLFGDLPRLEAQRRLALRDLGAGPFGAGAVEGAVLTQLVGRQDGQQRALGDDVAFVHEQAIEAALDLRADHDLVGGDDAGEDEFGRRPVDEPVDGDAGGDEQERQELPHDCQTTV
jgi:hypothetical protein